MIRLKPKALLCLVLAGMIVHQEAAYAQNDELDQLFEDEALDEPVGTFNSAPPPPPPPPTDFGNTSPPAGFPQDNPGDFSGGGDSGGSGLGGKGLGAKAPGSKGAPGVSKKKVNITEANIEDITNENFPDLLESFDYPNAEITDVVKAISQLTGKNFIIDPGVRGKISIIAPSQITVAEAYKAFLSALAINSFTIVPSGKFLKIKNARVAQRDSIETYSGKYYPNSDIMITRIVHLKHISAEEVNKNLRILPSKDGEMTPYSPTNSIIISDYGSNIERIMKIISELDRPGFEEQLAVVPIRYAKSKDLADLIMQIINKDSGGKGGAGAPPAFGAGVPRFRGSSAKNGQEELSIVTPDDRTNALIVVGNKAGIDKVRDLVKKLDYKLDPAEAGGFFVYYVKYGEAEKIAQTLSGVTQASGGGAAGGAGGAGAGGAGGTGFGGRAASPLNSQSIFGGDVKITADKNTNSLVVIASKIDYEKVLTLLAKLDIPKDQVFVEAIIMEMNSAKKKAWNPTIYAFDSKSNGVGRVGFSGGDLQSIINPANDQGVILGFGSGDKVKLTIPGTTNTTVEVPTLFSFIKLLQQNTESNILSTPRILALDNEDATIEVGDQIPIAQEQATTGNTVSTNTKFEKASIKLKITPFIRPDSETVRLKIDQSVKQPAKTQIRAETLQKSTVVISDRTIQTNINIRNGDTAVLGGLVRDEDQINETKVPILGDIPILGWLFKSKSTETAKVNLVVFLTPKIIRNLKDGHDTLNKITNERIDWLKRNYDGRDPYGQKIDSLPRAAANEEGDVDADRPPASVPNTKKKRAKRR